GSLSPDIMNLVGPVVLVQLAGSLLLRRRMVASIPEDLPPEIRVSRYTTACIVALALIEGGGILVITFAIITDVATWALVGGGSAVLLMLMARPSQAELDTTGG
ncbi:MAG: hypothetical protein R3253_14610, partial [Longimicrobiales bacterium]|nr:hypothetical protein [Longimicrobiales bacterium]